MEKESDLEEIKQLCIKIETSKEKVRLKTSKELIQKISNFKNGLLNYKIFESMMNKLYENDQKVYFDITMNLFSNNNSEFGIFREKLLNKVMQRILDCNTNESIIRDISLITYEGKNLDYLNNKTILIEFIFFKCLLKEKMFNHKKLWQIIENILCQNNNNEINIIQLQFYCNICIISSFNLKEKNDFNVDILETLINICGYYLLNINVQNYAITKNIILLFLFNIPIKEEILLNFYKKKPFVFFQIINELLRDFNNIEIHFFYYGIEDFILFLDEEPNNIITKKDIENIFKGFIRYCNIRKIIKENKKLINEHIYDFIHILSIEYNNIKFDKESKTIIKIDDIIFLEYIIKILINDNSNELLDKVVLYLLNLIQKNVLFEQWKYIFKIINDFLLIKKDNNVELYNIKVEEIFEEIESLYHKNLYYGDINDLIEILSKITIFKTEILINFQIDLLLKERNNFLSNLEIVIKRIVNNYPNFSFCKNYLMEIILNNYNYSFISEGNDNERIKLIENLLIKYFSQFLQCFNNIDSNYIYFSYLLKNILTKTINIQSFNEYLDKLININFDKGNNNSIANNITINIIRELFENLCKNWDTKKLNYFIKFFFGNKSLNNPKVLKNGVRLIKNIKVDDAYQIILPNNIVSPLIINYKNTEIQNQKDKLDIEDFKKFKKQFYLPFIQFKHIKIFQALNHQLLGNTTNITLIKDILMFYIIAIKSFFFLKDVNLDEFILIIAKDEDISKFSLSKDITHYILKIFILLNNQINSNLIRNDIKVNNQSIFKLNNLTLTKKIIFSLLNTWNKLNDENFSYLKNYPKNNFFDTKFKDSNSIWSGQLTLNISLGYILDFIKIIKFYLFSLIEEFNTIKYEPSFYSKQSTFHENLKDKLNKEYGNPDLNIIIRDLIRYINESLFFVYISKEYSLSIISLLYEIRDLLFNFGDEKIINIIYIILMIGWPYYHDNIINTFDKFFFTNFNMKQFKKEKYFQIDFKNDNKEKDLLNSEIGNEYLQFFCDITCLYYLEKIGFSKTMFDVLKNIFPQEEKQSIRENIFFSMAKWNLMTRTNRKNIYNTIIESNSQIYLGNNNIILINPKNKIQYEVIFKNLIVDISYFISSKYQKKKKEKKSKDDNNIFYIKENILFNEKSFSLTEEEINELKLISKQILFQLINYTGGLIEDYTLVPEKYLSQIITKIFYLDIYSPILIYCCGIIYFPNLINYNNEDEIFLYKNEVSTKYINFLSKIGDLYNINLKENLNINIGKTMKRKKENQYILMYNNNSLFQIVFHVSNLLNENNIKDILYNDELNIIWMENPLINLDLFLSKVPINEILIFIVIFPVTETHYFIKRYYSNGVKYSFIYLIDKIFVNEMIININNINSIYLLLRMIMEIKEMIKYEKYHLQHLNSEIIKKNISFDTIPKKYNAFQKQINNFSLENNFTKRNEIIKEITQMLKK